MAAKDRARLVELHQLLDPGEAEAIILALELQASLILIDEQRSLISECKPILDGMIEQAGFWIGSDLRARFLVALGEQP